MSVEGPKVKIVYEFDLDGNSLESTIKGELKGTTLAGDYHTEIDRRWVAVVKAPGREPPSRWNQKHRLPMVAAR